MMAEEKRQRFPEEYTVRHTLGEGGTSHVYLATRRDAAMPQALKCFHHPTDTRLAAREMRLAASVSFPGLVRIYHDGVTADGRPFLAMEYCDGPTLESCIGILSEEKFLSILSALSLSLTMLHQAGFVHNDIKPANIFCPRNMADDDFACNQVYYLKLSDFSLARHVTDADVADVTGTVGFMSPEMILKKEVTTRSDLFSLGVLAYLLACGRMPFSSPDDDPLEINAQITEGVRPDFSGPGQMYSTGTRDIISALLAINPADRPESAFALTETLARAGSRYPFRRAIRPRHLLSTLPAIDAEILTKAFGSGSFSNEHLEMLDNATRFEPSALRLLLEHNFDCDNFTRLDERWGWRTEGADCIAWPPQLSRLCLRQLRQSPLSLKKVAMASALIKSEDRLEALCELFSEEPAELKKIWMSLPAARRPALLHSLRIHMCPRTRKSLARRLCTMPHCPSLSAEVQGQLYYFAGDCENAVTRLMEAVENYSNSRDMKKAFACLTLALEAASTDDDRERMAEILYRRAELEKNTGRSGEAEKSYYAIIDLLSETPYVALVAQAYKSLGDLYKEKSDYTAGIRVLDQARLIYEQTGDRLGLSHTHNNLGNMYWVAGKLDKSIEQYNLALDIQRELNSEKDIASSLNNIGGINILRGDFAAGIKCLTESLELKKILGDKGEIARTYNNIGVTYFMMGHNIEALNNSLKSYELNCDIGNKIEQLLNLENLAEISIQIGRLNDALGYLRTGTELSDALNDDVHRSTMARLTGQMLRRMGYFDESEVNLLRAIDLGRALQHQTLVLPVCLGLARLYHDLKDDEAAEKHLLSASIKAEELGDKQAQFHIALLQYQHTGQNRYIAEAKKLLQELKTPRDEALMNLVLLEQQNDMGRSAESASFVEMAGRYFVDSLEDLDAARYHVAVGQYHILADQTDSAIVHLKTALELAGRINLLPEYWQASGLLSQLAFDAGEFEMSFNYARRTLETIKKIAGRIKDSERMQRLYNDRHIISLLGRMKSLQKILGNKKGVTVGNP